MIYRENRDKFEVEAIPIPVHNDDAPEAERFLIKVVRVFRNDPCHGIQYKAGDEFEVMRSPLWNPDWSLRNE